MILGCTTFGQSAQTAAGAAAAPSAGANGIGNSNGMANPQHEAELPALRAAAAELPVAKELAARQAARMLREKNVADLTRALTLTGAAGFDAEAHSATSLCVALRHSDHLARATHLVTYAHARSPLEYCLKTANQHRAAWLLDRCGAQGLAWAQPPAPQRAPPRWQLSLFELPPTRGEENWKKRRKDWPLWPVPAGAALARAMLIERVGGAPHGGFIMPPQVAPDCGFGPRIEGPLAAWRAANPDALVANVAGRLDLTDVDFGHLAGIKALDMSKCTAPTDAAFAHLRGIHTLWMWGCTQDAISDAAFAHLRGIHTLSMWGCRQATITDAAFSHLRGIQALDLSWCDQDGIMGATFAHLRGVRLLLMFFCNTEATATARALGLPVDDLSMVVRAPGS